ncbi:MAG: AEC family transporter [Methanocalculaceae archaeon]|nr:AEC family transporter [Methanocalculaceae archaeon]
MKVLILLLIIGVGYFARKYDILSKDSVGCISKFVLYVALPALILVSSTCRSFNSDSMGIVLLLLIASGLYYVISTIVALVVPRLICSKSNEIGVYRFILVFPSAVFFAFPIIKMIFGMDGILYAAIFNLPYFLLTFSLGIWLMTSSLERNANSFKFDPKILLNFAFIATLIGLFLYFASIPIPQPFNDTLGLLGDLATPLALIATGGFLFEVDFSALFRNYRHYLIAAVRLFVLPLLVFTVLKFVLPSDIPDMNMIFAIPVIIAGMPAAVQTVIIADKYNAHPEIAAEIILVTTLLATITVPLLFIAGFIPR